MRSLRPILRLIVIAAFAVPAGAAGMAANQGMPSSGDTPLSSDAPGASSARIKAGASGVVRSAGGAPVAGAVVLARSLDTPARPIPEIAIMTNENGVFTWPLRPGRYELTPMLDGRRGAPAEVVVRRGALTQRDLVLGR